MREIVARFKWFAVFSIEDFLYSSLAQYYIAVEAISQRKQKTAGTVTCEPSNNYGVWIRLRASYLNFTQFKV